MSNLVFALVLALLAPALGIAENRGHCPPSPAIDTGKDSRKQLLPPSGNRGVLMLVVISDTGYVCAASVLKGLDKDSDSKALDSIRKWHFKPALKDGQPVPVSSELFVTVDVNGNPEPQSTVKH